MSTELRNRKGNKKPDSAMNRVDDEDYGGDKTSRDGGGIGGAIDGAKKLMGRIITVIQIIAIAFAIFKVIEMDRKFKQKLAEMKVEWEEGWERHDEAMAALKQEWKEGWNRHDVAVEELKKDMMEHWKEGWERHRETMEKLGEKMPEKLTDFIHERKEKYRNLKDHLLHRDHDRKEDGCPPEGC